MCIKIYTVSIITCTPIDLELISGHPLIAVDRSIISECSYEDCF